MNHARRAVRPRRLLGLTVGQWQTILLAVLLGAALILATLPPVLEEVR